MGEAKQKAASAAEVQKVHFTDVERLQVYVALTQKPAESYEERRKQRSLLRALDVFEPRVVDQKDESGRVVGQMIVVGRNEEINETRVFDLNSEIVGQLIDALEGKHANVRKFVLLDVEDRLRDVKRGAYALPAEFVVDELAPVEG